MANTSELLRGHTDTILLAQLAKGDSYGYQLGKAVSEATAGALELKEATLYTAFRRLEELGYIASYWGNDGPGARRRYYTITAAGKEACHRLKTEWNETKEIMDKLLELEESK